MARIPEEEIERIKTGTNLVALIQSRGVSLKQKGQNWTGLCPFHDDKQTPNLIVTPGKGLFRCMAANCVNGVRFFTLTFSLIKFARPAFSFHAIILGSVLSD